ncbi:integrase core domain-containing protein [Burkholderia orbicola]|uniref:integrase core domain-containing protein n=1 Tax=Burkholderia orbicola TaxID=2978683 RepID=UPI003A5C2415
MPKAIRCDNGPEYVSTAGSTVRRQARLHSTPQQNAYVKRFNRTVRYEWRSPYHWEDLDRVQRFATEWMRTDIMIARTWLWADLRQSSGWPWSCSFYF